MAKKSGKAIAQRSDFTAQNFANRYGQDENKLEAWQRLCRDIGVAEGSSITQCKKNIKGVFVNIVDFISAVTVGQTPPRHPSAKALREYSRDEGKIFQKSVAKKNKLLSALLIHMF